MHAKGLPESIELVRERTARWEGPSTVALGELPQLRGRYVFGDWSRSFAAPDGTLLAATPRKQGLWRIQELQVDGNSGGRLGQFILGFGRDARGEIYVLTSQRLGPTGDTGRVFQLVKPGR